MKKIPQNYFLKDGYTSRVSNVYFEDSIAAKEGIVHQPDIYALAAYLGRKLGCTHILDIGCGQGDKLVNLHPEFKLAGVAFGANIEYCRTHYPFGNWFTHDLEMPLVEILPSEIMSKTLVICSDVIEHLLDPRGLLQTLRYCLEYAPIAILSTPERDLVRGNADMGPPINPAHVREWNSKEFRGLLNAANLDIAFSGRTSNNDRDLEKKTILTLIHGKGMPDRKMTIPGSFKVVAFMTSFNEEDIIYHSVSRLINSGVEVYLIDNWSTDKTVAILEPLVGKGLINIERFPSEGGTGLYQWGSLLTRIEELTREIQADWYIHHDVDEIRESPWPDLTLRESLYYADHMGFNAIDHTVINFHPVDNGFISGSDFGEYFSFWEFGKRPGHFQQVKAWKNLHQQLTLACTGGHDVNFPGRKVFPYKFLMRHYPIRSQAHGEKKIFFERKPRFTQEEHVEKGWHVQYNHIEKGHNFLKDPRSLTRYDANNFYQNYLVERISGVGIIRSDKPRSESISKKQPSENLMIKSKHQSFARMGYSLDPSSNVWLGNNYKDFTYSDGDHQEKYIYDAIRSSNDVSCASDELRFKIKDWPSEYHLSPLRKNLLAPFLIKDGTSILELGCGMGAITRYLGEMGAEVTAIEGSLQRAAIARERCRDLENVQVVCDNFKEFRTDEKFDIVTLIGVLEYSPKFIGGNDPIGECLSIARNFLKPEGSVIIAIENRLGLKYWNNCAEDHTGRIFDSIHDTYPPGTVSTFGYEELKNLLTMAGFMSVEFLFPFPDYKLPSVILQEGSLKEKEISFAPIIGQQFSRDYSGQSNRYFSERLAWTTIEKNGLIPHFSNSFLCVCTLSPDVHPLISKDWIVKIYSSSRSACFRTETTIYRDKTSNAIRVSKYRIYPYLPTHQGPLVFNQDIEKKYIQGFILSDEILRAVLRCDTLDIFFQKLNEYKDAVLSISRMLNPVIKPGYCPGELFDCTPFNLVRGYDGVLHYIDNEWIAKEDLPLNFILLRGIVEEIVNKIKFFDNPFLFDKFATLKDLVAAVFNAMGLELLPEDIEYYCIYESSIQAQVAGVPHNKSMTLQERKDTFSEPLHIALSIFDRLPVYEIFKLKRDELIKDIHKKITDEKPDHVMSERLKNFSALHTIEGRITEIKRLYKEILPQCINDSDSKAELGNLHKNTKISGILNSKNDSFQNNAECFYNYPHNLDDKTIITGTDFYYKGKHKSLCHDDNLLISVIVSTYNSKAFIRGCLEDLEKQTIASKIEIIIIEKGSDQSEWTIVYEFQNRYKNIIYLRTNPGETIYQAWNRGIKAAGGKYITNANINNRLRPDALETLSQELERNPNVALVYGNHFITNIGNIPYYGHIRCGYDIKPNYNPAIMLTGCHMGPQPMWRKSIHDELGYFDDYLSFAGDYEFWCRIATKYPMKHINKILGLCYKDPNGMKNSDMEKNRKETELIKKRYSRILPPPGKTIVTGFYNSQVMDINNYVNICMVTCNRIECTKQAIEAIVRYTNYSYVLSVVDNNSQDDTRDYLKELKQTGVIKNLILLNENVGIAKASNLAWHLEPDADYYLKLDNDIVIQKPDWLTNMVKAINAIPEAGAIGYSLEQVRYPLCNINNISVRVNEGNLGGACILIPKRTEKLLGYWREDCDFQNQEYADYGNRILQAGLKNIYMEDENIGIRLHEDNAAIDAFNFSTKDLLEKRVDNKGLMREDGQRQKDIKSEGIFTMTFDAYGTGVQPLYIESSFTQNYYKENEKWNSIASCKKLKIGFFSSGPHAHACPYIRLKSPLTFMQMNGSIDYFSLCQMVDNNFRMNLKSLSECDIIIVQREVAAIMPYGELIRYVDRSRQKIVYELDDAFNSLPPTHISYNYHNKIGPFIDAYVLNADLVIVSTEKLKRYYNHLNNKIAVIPNSLDTQLWKDETRNDIALSPVHILFSGTLTHADDLNILEDVIEKVLVEFGNKVRFLFWGNIIERLKRRPQVKVFASFKSDYAEYAKTLSCAPIDFAIIPLEDNAFNQAKSHIKWLEYSACKIPGIYSNVGEYRTSIRNRETGILVDNNATEWYEAIKEFVLDNNYRKAIADAAYKEVLMKHTLEKTSYRWLQAFNNILKSSDIISVKDNGITKPKVSIIIPVFNKKESIEKCIDAVYHNTESDIYELIIVDNGLIDTTKKYTYLMNKKVKTIHNDMNLGFAKCVNQGIAEAKGKLILLLNSNLVVTKGWLKRLIDHLNMHPDIGTVGPMSNGISGPQSVQDVPYGKNIADMQGFAREFTYENLGKTTECIKLDESCILIEKRVIDIIGCLDERYNSGRFAIEDLCLKLCIAGYKNIIAQDVFIHNNSSTAFKGNDLDLQTIIQDDHQYFASKWKDVVECSSNVYKIHLTKEQQRNKLVDWGEELLARGNVSGAAKIFERVFRLVSTDFEALNNLGVIQWQIGEAVSAINTFQTALSVNPKDPGTLANLLQAATESGRFDLIKLTLLSALKQAQPSNSDVAKLIDGHQGRKEIILKKERAHVA